MKISLILTCEHAGNRVPQGYSRLFQSRRARAALKSHRGIDLGALALARSLSRTLAAPLLYTTVTRLLIETNRSLNHPKLLSEFSRSLEPSASAALIEKHYAPHRRAVLDAVATAVAKGGLVVHVGVHSFTPQLGTDIRRADIGLLYDPQRGNERTLARALQSALRASEPAWRVRLNYPYRGNADGLTTALRRLWQDGQYAGIELEVNQALLAHPAGRRVVSDTVGRALAETIKAA